ncbi:MAG: hypothetical protein FJX52_03790 [Alphaproteobacteria bacterium]|nr:hypothetical protein [Alphaproteobacteria bacterium]
MRIYQDAKVYAADLRPSARLSHELAPGRSAWIQIVRGSAALGGAIMTAGDGAAVTGETALALSSAEGGEVLLFDLP